MYNYVVKMSDLHTIVDVDGEAVTAHRPNSQPNTQPVRPLPTTPALQSEPGAATVPAHGFQKYFEDKSVLCPSGSSHEDIDAIGRLLEQSQSTTAW